MQRRTFCVLSSTALVGALLPLTGCSQNPLTPEQQSYLALPAVLATFSDAATISELGKAYLDQSLKENTPSRLVGLLMRKADGSEISNSVDRDTLQNLIAENVQSDFLSGETVQVNGWILSRTEARQCALFSLTKPGA